MTTNLSEAEMDLYRDVYGFADEIGNRTHIVYQGRGFDGAAYVTRVKEWGHAVVCSEKKDGKGTYGLRISRMDAYERSGFYIPECGITIGQELVYDAMTHWRLRRLLSDQTDFARRFVEEFISDGLDERNKISITRILEQYVDTLTSSHLFQPQSV